MKKVFTFRILMRPYTAQFPSTCRWIYLNERLVSTFASQQLIMVENMPRQELLKFLILILWQQRKHERVNGKVGARAMKLLIIL